MPPGLNPVHVLIVLVVALIVLGPEKLPTMARQAGKALAELRRWSTSLQDEVRNALDVDDEPMPPSPTPTITPADAAPEVVRPIDLARPPAEEGGGDRESREAPSGPSSAKPTAE